MLNAIILVANIFIISIMMMTIISRSILNTITLTSMHTRPPVPIMRGGCLVHTHCDAGLLLLG